MKSKLRRRDVLKASAAAGVLCGLPASTEGHPTTPVKRLSIADFSQDPQMIGSLRAAVSKMRSLPPRHPFSWVYQANIHWRPFFPDYVYQQADESDSPDLQIFRDNTGFSPEDSVFSTCPHGNWWFLPWHRWYLYYFEKILRWASGNPNLALPYWNYSAADQRELPVSFRTPTVSSTDSTPNSLYLPATVTFRDPNGNPQIFSVRDQSLNLGFAALSESITNNNALNVVPFSNNAPTPAREAFGSRQTCDPTCGCGSGSVERIPHNMVHVAIGGAAIVSGETVRVGFMGDVSTAARDPLFWLHHCQIDRLWESWLAQGNGRLNPQDPAWLGQEFTFIDVSTDGKPIAVTKTPATALDTTQLGYVYDKLETIASPTLQPTQLVANQFQVVAKSEMPEVVVKSSAQPGHRNSANVGIPLSNSKPKRIAVDLMKGIERQAFNKTLAQSPRESGELFLSIEGIQLAHQPGVYFDVYLGLPSGLEPSPQSAYYLGSISFFGASHHSTRTIANRLQPESLLVSEQLRKQLAANSITPTVTFVPQTGVVSTAKNRAIAERSEHANAVTIEQVKLIIVR